jgi:hypothetical protein
LGRFDYLSRNHRLLLSKVIAEKRAAIDVASVYPRDSVIHRKVNIQISDASRLCDRTVSEELHTFQTVSDMRPCLNESLHLNGRAKRLGNPATAIDFLAAINRLWCPHTTLPQSGHEGNCLPVTLRHMAHQPLAAGTTAVQSHHLGVGRGLIKKYQPSRIQHALLSHPAPPCPHYVRVMGVRSACAAS